MSKKEHMVKTIEGEPLNIRSPSDHELTVVASLLGRLLELEGRVKANIQTQVASLKWLNERPDNGRVLCGCVGKTIIASATLHYTMSTARGELTCRIEDVFVDEAHRRRGHGSRIVQAAIQRAKEDGCGEVFLHVSIKNHEARKLYTKLGFEASPFLLMRLEI